jgi:hypothetical protein
MMNRQMISAHKIDIVIMMVLRVKLLRLTPEPKPISIGIAAPKGRLSPVAEEFWQCAKEAAPRVK